MIFGSLCVIFVLSIFSSFGLKSVRDRFSSWLGLTFVLWNLVLFIHEMPVASGTNGVVPSKKSTNLGATLVLDCSIPIDLSKKDITMTVSWKKQGLDDLVLSKYNNYPPNIHPQFKGRIRLVQGISLEVSHIKEDDEGWYECSYEMVGEGVPTDKKGNGTWIYLDVKTPPKITNSSPPTVRGQQGKTVEIFCQADGDPTPTITWIKDRKPLFTSPWVDISAAGDKVKIHDLKRGDGGTYTCTCTNRIGTISQIIDVIVEGAAYILTAPSNTTVIDGHKARFFCRADAYPANITYQWLFDNYYVQQLPDFKKRINILDTGELVIHPVKKEDMGWYTCRPTNGVGRDPTAQAYLNVTYLPRVLNMPSRVIWAMGLQAQLDCPVDANPPATEIIWVKNSYVLDYHSDKLTQLANGSLYIYSVVPEDAGSYACRAISQVGTGNSSPLVQVDVRDPPKFTMRPQSRYFSRLKDRVILPCAATGKPTPQLRWRKVSSGKLILSTRVQIIGGNLTIARLEKEDHGKYECEAENEVARMVVTTELIVQQTTPHAPYNLTVTTRWFEATLKWIPAYDGGSQQTYMIWYRTIDGGSSQWETMRVEPQNATTFTVYNLYPDMTYEFKVAARNVHGKGSDSEITRARTLGNVTPLPTALPTDPDGKTYFPELSTIIGPRPDSPRNVTAFYQNGGIRISWFQPASKNLTLFYFVIEVKKSTTWEPIGDHITYPTTTYFYTDVQPATTYQFHVVCYGLLAYSYPSNTAIVTTPYAGSQGLFLSAPEIGGIIGGGFFLLVSIILVVIAVLCSKRRGRHRGDKYGNVKYIGPADEMDSHGHMPINNRTENTPEWYSWGDSIGGTGSLSSIDIGNGIFVMPYSNMTYREDTLPKKTYFQDSQIFDPDKCMYRQPVKRRKKKISKKPPLILRTFRGDPDDLEDRQSLSYQNENGFEDRLGASVYPLGNQSISRLYQQEIPVLNENGFEDRIVNENGFENRVNENGFEDWHGIDPYRSLQRFPPEEPSDRVKQSFSGRSDIGDTSNSGVSIKNNHSFSRSDIQRAPSFQKRSFPVLRTSHELNRCETDDEDDDYDDENGFCPRVPPLPKGYRFPYEPDVYMGPFHQSGFGDPYSYPGDTDDVFLPPDRRASFPRQSSMKPTYQTYLTGDPVNNSFGPSFDVSSVHPSFVEKVDVHSPDRSRESLPRVSTSPRSRDLSRTLTQNRTDLPDWSLPRDPFIRSESRTPSRVHFENSGSNITILEQPDAQSTLREKRVARVTPHKQTHHAENDGKSPGYTREQLQGAVDRVRRSLRARKSRFNRSSGSETDRSFDTSSSQVESRHRPRPYLSDSVLPSGSQTKRPRNSNDSDVVQSRSLMLHSDYESPSRTDRDRHGGAARSYHYEYDIEPYKTKRVLGSNRNSVSSSGRGSSAGRTRYFSEPSGYNFEQATPDSLSSGIGSKNTSHGTGSSSLHSRNQRATSASVSSLLTPLGHDDSQDSSPFLDGISRERRDTSADENYEFDALNALDSDLMDALHKYSSLHSVDDELMAALESGLSTSDFYNDLYPKPSRQSRYNNSEERFQKLRQEFHQYQRQQQEAFPYHGQYVSEMDSEML